MTKLDVTVDKDVYEPGEAVHGRVTALEGGKSRQLTVELCFCEYSNGYGAVAHSIPAASPLATGAIEDGRTFPFELHLPPDAPPNWGGPGGELYWEVRARSDQLGRDATANRRIGVKLPP